MIKSASLHNTITGRTARIFLALFCLLAILSGITFPLLAEDDDSSQNKEYYVGVHDQCGFLSDAEVEKITDLAEQISRKRGVHVVVLTVFEKDGYSNTDAGSESLAEDFYLDCTRSYDKEDPGFLFLLDMENRYMYIFTHNRVHKEVSNSACVDITETVTEEAQNEQYYEMIRGILNGVDKEIDDYYRSLKVLHVIITILGGVVPTVIVLLILLYRKRSQITTDFMTYLDVPQCRTVYDGDIYLKETVSVTTSSSGGSGGGGGGGGSSGGGGSHF